MLLRPGHQAAQFLHDGGAVARRGKGGGIFAIGCEKPRKLRIFAVSSKSRILEQNRNIAKAELRQPASC